MKRNAFPFQFPGDYSKAETDSGKSGVFGKTAKLYGAGAGSFTLKKKYFK